MEFPDTKLYAVNLDTKPMPLLKPRSILHSLSFCFPGLMVAIPASAEIEIHDSRADYIVQASNAIQLSEALKKANHARQGNMIEVALTTTKLSVQMKAKGHGAGCRIDQVTITADIQIRMPELSTSSPFLQAQWNHYYPHLLEHEMQHRAISLATAEQMEREILALPDQHSCDKVIEDANATFQRLHLDGQRAQLLFDEAEYASGRLELNNFFKPKQRQGTPE